MITIEQIMEQHQVVSSAWSIVGSRFDDGSALETHDQEKTELRAMIKQYRKEAVPDGWQLVPINPTSYMIDSWRIDQSQGRSLESSYQAMLSAAPKPDSNLPELLKPQSPEY